jgi:diguanylate cyclase (GGDEF)-like protein/PAS domain S-box-containing protein
MTLNWYFPYSQLNSFPFPLCTIDKDGNFLFVNKAFKEFLGYSDESFEHTLFSMIKNDEFKLALQQVNVTQTDLMQAFEISIDDQARRERRIHVVAVPAVHKMQYDRAFHIIIRDSTSKIEKELSDTREQLKHIFDSLDVSVWSMDLINNKMLQVSQGAEKIYGVPTKDFMENPLIWKSLIHHEDFTKVDASQKKLQTGIPIMNEYRIICPNGEMKWIHDRVIPQLDANGSLVGLTGVGIDITERKQMEQEIEQAAYYDALTKLPNRKVFEIKLKDLIRTTPRRLALFHLDMDRFKTINDTLGNEIGDSTLIVIADRLNAYLSKEQFVARIGDDEFILLCEIDTATEVIELAEQILKCVETEILIDNYEFFVTTSIGISIFPDDGRDLTTLTKSANTALIRAKEQGKNRFQFFTPTMNIKTFRAFTLERDLRKAMERNEFVVYYQPRVDSKTNQIKGAEALIRWIHPDWGMVSPNDFIPLAEETGLIVPMGEWVLREACKQNKSWQTMGFPPITIAVNVSPKQLMQKNIDLVIRKTLKETGLDAQWLELEITENSLMQTEQISTLKTLHDLGVFIAIDDFGIGYSSLNYMKVLKAHSLKIDKSFIQNSTTSPDDAAIVVAVTNLAHTLKMKVIAEGVETKEQLAFVQQNHCDEVQGYLFSPAVAAIDFSKMLKSGKCIVQGETATLVKVVDKREYFRVKFQYPLLGQMTIKEIRGKKVDVGFTNILIENIGPGGFMFVSNLDFSIHSNIYYHFQLVIMGTLFELTGQIIWRQNAEGEIHKNGVVFIMNELERLSLIRILNVLTIQMKKGPLVPECNFIVLDKVKFLKSKEENLL